ncbi:MAG: ATP-binding protein [Patescibacteria group bacterium]
MKIYKRTVEEQLREHLFKGKVIILYGPRQVGKTTLVKKLLEEFGGAYFLCEEPDVNDALTHKTSTEMQAFLGNRRLIVLDEAQKVRDIGTSLKLLIDTHPEMQIIATGSSSFDLANQVNEPLTGRNYEFHLYPLSTAELVESSSLLETKRLLEQHLTYGVYPEVQGAGERRVELLGKITNDYLYKDVLSYGGIRKPHLLQKILKALALQVGGQVSYNEVARTVGADRQTVMSYVDILEKAFIVFRLYPLSSRERDELRRLHKVYFWDNGILNTVIQNYNALDSRHDAGSLFENFYISEKMKKRAYGRELNSVYFWRTKKGQEIDFVEEYRSGEEYRAYECKLTDRRATLPNLFKETYSTTSFKIISRENVIEDLIGVQKAAT